MADLRVVISALNKASGDLAKVKGDIKDVGDAGKDAKGGVDGFADGIGSILGKAALVAGSVAAVATALREVYDLAKKGAELEYARTRFDNLAASIGTVSDALLSDLKDATGGMMSDAELVAGAADFMALGLAKSHDEVVRLTDVAGALGMNMNQLVLTLTNQTTMRFDALGVSVDGFDAKVKALEDSGMSASEAFTEAFLQQAEAQIGLVGNKAETSAGKIQIMESAFKNLGDATKLSMADAMDGIAPVMTSVANHMIENVDISGQWKDAIDQLKAAKDKDLISGKEYNSLLRDIGVHSGMGAVTAEQLATAQAKVNQIYGYAEDGTVTYTEAIAETSAAIEDQTMAIFENTNSWEEFKSQMEGAGIGLGMLTEDIYNSEKGITRFSDSLNITEQSMSFEKNVDLMKENMTSLMEQLSNAQLELDVSIKTFRESVGSDLVEGLRNAGLEGEELETRLKVLDEMFGTSYAIEYKMELATGDLLQALLDDPESFKAKYSGFEAEFLINDEQVVEAQGKVDTLQETINDLTSKMYTITFAFRSTGGLPVPGEGVEMFPRAVGGSVNAGNPYTWQEYGYRGEVFVPSADGFVLSRADAERALARALYGGGSAVDPAAIGKAVAQAMSGVTAKGKGGNVYNLTMPTSNNPADVRTAFELMEAWGA